MLPDSPAPTTQTSARSLVITRAHHCAARWRRPPEPAPADLTAVSAARRVAEEPLPRPVAQLLEDLAGRVVARRVRPARDHLLFPSRRRPQPRTQLVQPPPIRAGESGSHVI